MFIGDDAEIREAAGHAWVAMWDHHPDQLRDSSRVAPPEMWAYVQRAQDVRGTG